MKQPISTTIQKQKKRMPITLWLFSFLFLVLATLTNIPARADTVSVQLQIPIPGIGASIPICTTSGGALECTGIASYVVAIYRWLIGFAAVLSTLALAWGGVRWLTSAGESSAVQDAQKVMANAIIGLLLALGSYGLLYAINPNLVQYSPLSIKKIAAVALKLDPPEAGPREVNPIRVILHHSAGGDSGAKCSAIERKRKDGTTAFVDCTYFMKRNGELINCIPERRVSDFCTGRANAKSIGIEVVNNSADGGGSFTAVQIATLAEFIKAAQGTWGIPLNNTVANFDTTGGVFTHATVCSVREYNKPDSNGEIMDHKIDASDVLLKAVLQRAGGTYLEGQKRCGPDPGAKLENGWETTAPRLPLNRNTGS